MVHFVCTVYIILLLLIYLGKLCVDVPLPVHVKCIKAVVLYRSSAKPCKNTCEMTGTHAEFWGHSGLCTCTICPVLYMYDLQVVDFVF